MLSNAIEISGCCVSSVSSRVLWDFRNLNIMMS